MFTIIAVYLASVAVEKGIFVSPTWIPFLLLIAIGMVYDSIFLNK